MVHREVTDVLKQTKMDSGCGSVGSTVASDSRGPWFETSNQQKIILNVYCQLRIGKTKIKKTRPGMVHLKKDWSLETRLEKYLLHYA